MRLRRFALSSFCILFFCFAESHAQRAAGPTLAWPGSRLAEYQELLTSAESISHQNPAQAEAQLQQALALTQLQGDQQEEVRVRLRLARLSERSPNGDASLRREALNDFLEIFRICTELQDTLCQAEALYHIGLGYAHFEDYKQAMTYLFKALPRFGALQDTLWMVRTCMEISRAFQSQDLITEAIEFSQEAQQLAAKTSNDSVRALTLRTTGLLHLVREEGGPALSHLEQARKLAEELPLSHSILIGLTEEAGQAALLTDDLALAGAYFEEAEVLSKRWEDSRGLAKAHLGQARIARRKGLYPAGLEFAEMARNSAQRNRYSLLTEKAFRELSRLYTLMGQPESADSFHQEAEKIAGMLANRRMREQLQKVRSRYAVKEIEDRLKFAEEREALTRAEIRTKRWQTGFALALGLSFLILTLILLKQYRQKREANAWLEAEVAARTSDLSEANDRLTQLNEELDRLAYRTAHDVRGPLARILGLSQLAGDTDRPALLKNYLKMLDQEAQQMDHLLHQFMEVNHVKHLPAERDFVALNPLLQEVFQACRSWEGFSSFTTEIRCPDLRVRVHKRALETILKQLLHNSIRFAHEKVPVCSIHAAVLPGGLEILVIDNGEAIPEDLRPNLFQMFQKGDDGRAGLGLGLYIAKMAADHMSAKLEYVPQARPGSVFRLFMPDAEVQLVQETEERHLMMPVKS